MYGNYNNKYLPNPSKPSNEPDEMEARPSPTSCVRLFVVPFSSVRGDEIRCRKRNKRHNFQVQKGIVSFGRRSAI